jgi:hypothetical protein
MGRLGGEPTLARHGLIYAREQLVEPTSVVVDLRQARLDGQALAPARNQCLEAP